MAVLADGRILLEGAPQRADRRDSRAGSGRRRSTRAELDADREQLRGHLDPPVRRPDGDPRPRRHATRATASSRSTAGSRTSTSRPSRHRAARPEGRRMFGKIARFEFRYQLRNPVFWVAAVALLPAARSASIASRERSASASGGNVHKNAPVRASPRRMLIMSVFFMFVTTAFVANVVVRDDETGFGPIIRSTRITKFDYLFGRFVGAFAAAALGFLARPARHLARLADAVGRPRDARAEPARRLRSTPTVVLALPNLLVTSAHVLRAGDRHALDDGDLPRRRRLPDRSSWSRSVAAARPGAAQLAAPGRAVRPRAPSTLATRYWTAAERNTLMPPIAGRCCGTG